MKLTEIKSIGFQIHGAPVQKERPRFRRYGRKVISYTPTKTKRYEEAVRSAFSSFADSVPCEDEDVAVGMELIFFMPIPEKLPKYRLKQIEEQSFRPLHKPDIDNLIKSVLDGLNGAAYHDDRQIISVSAEKYYSDNPMTQVIIHYYENGKPYK